MENDQPLYCPSTLPGITWQHNFWGIHFENAISHWVCITSSSCLQGCPLLGALLPYWPPGHLIISINEYHQHSWLHSVLRVRACHGHSIASGIAVGIAMGIAVGIAVAIASGIALAIAMD